MIDSEKLEEFYKDMQDVIILCIKPDKTVNMKSSIHNMTELKSVLSTAYMMATFHDVKREDLDVDNMH